MLFASYMPFQAFPAGAGMNREQEEMHRMLTGVPRRRGDEPVALAASVRSQLRSPQARG